MRNARYGSNTTAILKYEEAAWLLGQIPSHSTQVGEIQFAMWRIYLIRLMWTITLDLLVGIDQQRTPG